MLISLVPSFAQEFNCTQNADIKACTKEQCNIPNARVANPDNVTDAERQNIINCVANCLHSREKLDTLKPEDGKYCLFAYGKTGQQAYFTGRTARWLDFIQSKIFDKATNDVYYFGFFVTDNKKIAPGTKINRQHSYKLSSLSLDQCTYYDTSSRNSISPITTSTWREVETFPNLLLSNAYTATNSYTGRHYEYILDARLNTKPGNALDRLNNKLTDYLNKVPGCTAAIYLVKTNTGIPNPDVGNFAAMYGRGSQDLKGNLDTFPSELTVLKRVH